MADQPASTNSNRSNRSSWPFLGVFLSAMLPVVAAIVVVYQLESFDPAPMPLHELSPPQPAANLLRNQRMLQGAEFLGVGKLKGPEDIAYDRREEIIYTGCEDGWIKRVWLKSKDSASANNDTLVEVEDWVNTRGRPLGIVLGPNNEVIVADSYKMHPLNIMWRKPALTLWREGPTVDF
ncbi:Six-bladed beta-propeller, TolB-like protein [Corchorus olitorius]|uniref:Six-bladed beta-propeller, TolB-like protein n=1 Tax=Corchorus olitorius TaxID=93759 RepID=A0A1R3ILL6_9ROSI|nr:Six-bladed beta-propeller, TolB-like protein [Corchorus olitorius]